MNLIIRLSQNQVQKQEEEGKAVLPTNPGYWEENEEMFCVLVIIFLKIIQVVIYNPISILYG